MSRWFLLCLLLAGPAMAQSVSALHPMAVDQRDRSRETRAVTICLIPDTQNMFRQNDFDAVGGATECTVTSTFCTGASCLQSPYCYQNWPETGRILALNQAYSLTGQWAKIDYTKIDGTDNVVSLQDRPLDHARCDLILSLGDMLEIGDVNSDDFDELLAEPDYARQWALLLDYWGIIKASGIPYLPLQGNHDPASMVTPLFTHLNFSNESFHHASEATGRSHAILVPNATGVPLCVIGLGYNDTNLSSSRCSTVATWAASQVGCGGNYPTIITSHAGVTETALDESCGPGSVLPTLIGNDSFAGVAGASEIFLVAAGHRVVTTSYKFSLTGLFSTDANQTVYAILVNYQEANRHNVNDGGNGITTSDGNAGQYTVITLDAGADRMCSHEWNPYWQVRDGISNGQVTPTSTGVEVCWDFDFDARAP